MNTQTPAPRKFLVVVDRTPECRVAVRFAARRAQHTGGCVSLLCVCELEDYQQWRGVGEIMRAEARAEAESHAQQAATAIQALTGIVPEIRIEQGDTGEKLLELIRKDQDISIVVLASGTSEEGPGPLVGLFGKSIQPIPATIVPGNLSDAEIDAIA